MRVGLGCMRLSTEAERDEAQALATLDAAWEAGIRLFDTAHAYGTDEADRGHNERLLARAFANGAESRGEGLRIVTKCGMARDGGAWIPDGRARRIERDVDESLEALGGLPIDVLLLHAPDRRVPLATTARALARAQEKGLVRAVGVSNVSRKELEEIAAHAPVAAVECALGAFDDLAIRSGVVGYCLARDIEVLAHAPFGGPDRRKRLARDAVLAGLGPPEGVVLAYLRAVDARLVPIVGARRPETIARLVEGGEVALGPEALATLDVRFPVLGHYRRRAAAAPAIAPEPRAEVVMLMGLPGAGKSRIAREYVERGYERLNRDALGGTLRGIAKRLGERLREGASKIVLDNTYVARATRSEVVRIAEQAGAVVRCVYLAIPASEAQINVAGRMLDRFGALLEPHELAVRAKEDPAALGPTAVIRMLRDLEEPADDEGVASIEVRPFVRLHPEGAVRGALVVALGSAAKLERDALRARIDAVSPDTPCLVYASRPDATDEGVRALVQEIHDAAGRTEAIEVAICRHRVGPTVCWCRPPMPGPFIAFARRHRVDPRKTTLIGTTTADRTLARDLGLTFVAATSG